LAVVLRHLDLYWAGLRTTVALTVLSFAAAFVIGVVMAACRVGPVAPLRWVSATYVEVVRNTPLTASIVLFFFGFTKVGIKYSAFRSAVIVLAVYTSAFVAETVRAGFNTVPTGQAEAARALGLTFPQVLWHIVLPQALRNVVSPLGSVFIALEKNSAIASVISVKEVLEQADRLNTATARSIPVFLGAAIAFLLLTIPSGLLVGVLERKVAIKR